VTRDEKGWGRTLYDAFRKRGYDTYAINPSRAIRASRAMENSAIYDEVDGVLLAVPRTSQTKLCTSGRIGIPRVWMHRGAAGPAPFPRPRSGFARKDIAVVYGVCPMMYLQSTGIGHRLHHALPNGANNYRRRIVILLQAGPDSRVELARG